MKLTVTTAGSLVKGSGNRGRQGFVHTLSAGIRYRLQIDLDRELEEIIQSERAADADTSDPESRRDALERAVRRIWGATQ
jgi:hypothetical protein